jgi:streptogramin lyase
MWFTEFHAGKIGLITPVGTISEFSIPTRGKNVHGITAGPDGNIWFTITGGDTEDKIGRITPDGKITEFGGIAPHSGTRDITSGPDGNLWFTEYDGSKIGRITPQGAITEFPLPTPGGGPMAITAAPPGSAAEGSLIFLERLGARRGQITTDGRITVLQMRADFDPVDITFRIVNDGVINTWTAFHDNKTLFSEIRGDGDGFPVSSSPNSVIEAADRQIWATLEQDALVRIDWFPSGETRSNVNEFSLTPGSRPIGITAGPAQTVWFTEYEGNRIGRVNLHLAPPMPAWVPGPTKQTFPETGKTANGIFHLYWRGHGGVAQQGFPISDLLNEFSPLDGKLYTVQYFERAIFEYHLEIKPPVFKRPSDQGTYKVLLSQLGTFRYKEKYPNGAPGQKPNTSPGSRFFAETGHRVGGKFLEYWDTHGGLEQQGYPISDEFREVSDLDGKTYTVQYFERAVFELHPENQPPYDVLLSQLGTLRYRQIHPQP